MALRMWECTLVYKNTSTAEVDIKVWKLERVYSTLYSIYVTRVLCAAGLLDPTWAWAPTGSSSICPQSDQNRFYNRENQRPGCHSGCEIFTVSLNDRTVKVVQLVNRDRILYGQETSCLPGFCLSRTNIYVSQEQETSGLPRTKFCQPGSGDIMHGRKQETCRRSTVKMLSASSWSILSARRRVPPFWPGNAGVWSIKDKGSVNQEKKTFCRVWTVDVWPPGINISFARNRGH